VKERIEGIRRAAQIMQNNAADQFEREAP